MFGFSFFSNVALSSFHPVCLGSLTAVDAQHSHLPVCTVTGVALLQRCLTSWHVRRSRTTAETSGEREGADNVYVNPFYTSK